jgi:hypothetical protein
LDLIRKTLSHLLFPARKKRQLTFKINSTDRKSVVLLKSETLTIGVSKLPRLSELDFARVGTLSEHLLLQHLGGSPLFSHDSSVESIYAEVVSSSKNEKTWRVEFRPAQKFSDGSSLSASNWYHSIARNIKHGLGVHFNPKIEILGGDKAIDGYCSGLRLANNCVTLTLCNSNLLFRRLIGKIESSVLPISHSTSNASLTLDSPTSGPYHIENTRDSSLVLRLNPHYPFCRKPRFGRIELLQAQDEKLYELRTSDEVDFIFPDANWPEEYPNDLGQAHPYHGETIFLSFRDNSSSWSKDISLRKSLRTRLSRMPNLPDLTRTDTLLQGSGLGRIPSAPELNLGNERLPNISIAAVNSPRSHAVLNELSQFVDLKIIWVSKFGSLFEGEAINSDAFLGWNDFTSKDPYISLYNALNPNRPLFHNAEMFRTYLAEAERTDDSLGRSQIYQKLQTNVISESGTIPLYTSWRYSYVSSEIGLENLVGTCFWTL